MTNGSAQSSSKKPEHWLNDDVQCPEDLLLNGDNFNTVAEFIACWEADMRWGWEEYEFDGRDFPLRNEIFINQFSDFCINTDAKVTCSLHAVLVNLRNMHYASFSAYKDLEDDEDELVRQVSKEAKGAANMVNQHILAQKLEQLEQFTR